MRFYKSKKIGKGLKVSFSSSGGLRTGVGIPGFNVSTGKGGTYLNLGIPGTGISHRTKISGSTKKNTATQKTKTVSQEIKLHMDEDGKVTYRDARGSIITDQSMINKIKRAPGYSSEIQRMKEEMKTNHTQQVQEINAKNDEIINVIRYALNVYDEDYFIRQKEVINAAEYPQVKPNESIVQSVLEEEARELITGWKIWEVNKKRKEYVDQNVKIRLETELEKWKNEKEKFDLIAREEYNAAISFMDSLIEGDEKAVEECINSALQEITLPLDFNVSYDIRHNQKVIYVDIDLPEIEDLPDEVAVMLADGTIKMKKKSQKDLNCDYVKCVFGFAVLFATIFCSVSPYYKTIVISGYTQRRDKVGDICDDYVYSIRFEREGLKKIQDFSCVDPYEYCLNFENRCNMLKSGLLKSVTPFD